MKIKNLKKSFNPNEMDNIKMLELLFKMVSYHENSKRIEDKRNKHTLRHWRNKINIVSEFLYEHDLIQIKAVNFNKNVANSYFDWLINKKYKNNSAVRCVEFISQAQKFGVSKDILSRRPLDYLLLKRTRPETPTYFTPEQIKLWENYNSHNKLKQKAANLAILQINTGFDYGDFSEIRREHIKTFENRKFIVKPRHKNGNEAIIPLKQIVEDILELYDYSIKPMSNHAYNTLIKEICTELNIDIYIKSKSLRKVFVMDQLNNKCVPIEATSKMAGHKSTKTTEDFYGQVNIHLISNALNNLGI